jgi:hypothetical protein
MFATLSSIVCSREAAKVDMLTWSSWFADVGIESTLAGCASDLFSECRRRHLRHHEARVQPAFTDEERRQAAVQVWIDQQGDAPLGERADFGDREREVVGGEGNGLPMEVAARQHRARVGKDQRIVRDGVRLRLEQTGHVPQHVEAGAGDLRLAADRVRILHAAALDV